MFIIADSGATKVDWRAILKDNSIVNVQTDGINPMFVTSEQIVELLNTKLLPYLPKESADSVFFYGAGIVSNQIREVLASCFNEVFPKIKCYAYSDLLGAARALCGNNPGIACILGTGSNTCFYDGDAIVDNVRAGGFILGDEGSGAYIGKRFISDFIKGLLPKEISDKFAESYHLDYAAIVQKVYKEPLPSRFLAQFSPFIYENKQNPYVNALLKSCFNEFFMRNISRYDYKNNKVNIVGSVAYYYKDIIEQSAIECGMELGNILKGPISALVDYHKNK